MLLSICGMILLACRADLNDSTPDAEDLSFKGTWRRGREYIRTTSDLTTKGTKLGWEQRDMLKRLIPVLHRYGISLRTLAHQGERVVRTLHEWGVVHYLTVMQWVDWSLDLIEPLLLKIEAKWNNDVPEIVRDAHIMQSVEEVLGDEKMEVKSESESDESSGIDSDTSSIDTLLLKKKRTHAFFHELKMKIKEITLH